MSVYEIAGYTINLNILQESQVTTLRRLKQK